MTLREMRAAYPQHFYSQTWFDAEGFMDAEPDLDAPQPQSFVPDAGHERAEAVGRLHSAATLALLYLANPANPLWRKYLWTSDLDSQGQRVYVGDNGSGLEIHRHLHITDRWGFAL